MCSSHAAVKEMLNPQLLCRHTSDRDWLINLKASTAPLDATYSRIICIAYQKFDVKGFQDWPTDGPSDWLAKWETQHFSVSEVSVMDGREDRLPCQSDHKKIKMNERFEKMEKTMDDRLKEKNERIEKMNERIE